MNKSHIKQVEEKENCTSVDLWFLLLS